METLPQIRRINIPKNKYQKTIPVSDSLINLVTSMNSNSDRLLQSYHAPVNFFGYQEYANMYEAWLGRRIVDLIPCEALKRGWKIVCPSWDKKKIELLESHQESIKLKEKLLEALKSERVFGGSVITVLTDATWGSMRNPIPDFLPSRTLLTIQQFDAWQAYAATVNFMNPLADDFLFPVTYTIGSAGMISMIQANGDNEFLTGALVHNSRVERFGGEWLPWYERQRNLYWGQSILAIAYDAVRNAGVVDNSIASLIFRASVPLLKVKDLINIVADENAKNAFLNRINVLNYSMSNNNMAIIDQEEELSNLELNSLSGLDPILERFYVTVSAATGIPVTKLVGESAKGLNATGEGDLNNYYDLLEDYQSNKVKPHLISMYKRWIVPSFFDELLPADFDIEFPELERESPTKKQERDTGFITMVGDALDKGLIDLKVARNEVLDRGIFKNLKKEDIERMETEKTENEVELTDALDLAEELYKDEQEEDEDGVFEINEDEKPVAPIKNRVLKFKRKIV